MPDWIGKAPTPPAVSTQTTIRTSRSRYYQRGSKSEEEDNEEEAEENEAEEIEIETLYQSLAPDILGYLAGASQPPGGRKQEFETILENNKIQERRNTKNATVIPPKGLCSR
ncbi:hypothetical protein M8J76_002678 [Diaphorina citri]|nr:hypothetical protein M8J75_012204 [Diaphorina citri]KAI5716203.1 hypothetical protein M8J76_002678 [Diaphorina citri]